MKDIDTWFNSWDRLASVGLSAVVLYTAVVVMVRISGKRTTSQMNNFDWVITVAIGGLVSSSALFKNVSVADGLTGIAVLMLLQWITTSLVIRSKMFRDAVKPEPVFLLHKGSLLKNNMRKERVSEGEVYAALRQKGIDSLTGADWVILETDASFSVKARKDQTPKGQQELMSDVKGGPG